MWISTLPLQQAFVAESIPHRAQGQKIEGSQATTDELTLPACLITLRSEPAADNYHLGAGLGNSSLIGVTLFPQPQLTHVTPIIN
jgi:hypothetical protein